jgi:hypothetical protein
MESIINKLNADDTLKMIIKEKVIKDLNNLSIDLNTYNISDKIKEYYDDKVEDFYFTIQNKFKKNQEIEYVNMEKMSNALNEFINKYLLNVINKNELNKYVMKLFTLLFPYKSKNISLDNWLKEANNTLNILSKLIKNYIKSNKKPIYLYHIKVTKKQLLTLMYNYMNFYDENDTRLNLYINIDKYATNKKISSRTSIPIILKHIYYKSKARNNVSYIGPIDFTGDIIHLICKMFIKEYKLK